MLRIVNTYQTIYNKKIAENVKFFIYRPNPDKLENNLRVKIADLRFVEPAWPGLFFMSFATENTENTEKIINYQ